MGLCLGCLLAGAVMAAAAAGDGRCFEYLGAVVGVEEASSGGVGLPSDGEGDPGSAPSWPFRGVVDSGRSVDGKAALRYLDAETGAMREVVLGGGLGSELCWDATPFAAEEFVQVRFRDSAGSRLIRVPWGDEAYPVFARTELVLVGLDPPEGFGASFVEDVHRGSVLRVVTPHEDVYYDLTLEYFSDDLASDQDRRGLADCFGFGPDSTVGIGLELNAPPTDVVDYSTFSSQDHPRFFEYLEWARAAPRARFDGTDGLLLGFTILVPSWEAGPGSSDAWSFVFAGDTGELVGCRRAFDTVAARLVYPGRWPDLVHPFILPESFDGSGCVGANEWLVEQTMGVAR